VDEDVNSRIRTEGLGRSQVMRTLHFLTDVYGPRLTGSPSLRAAGEWSVKTMEGWGLKNAHLESWDFGHSGWQNEVAWGAVVSPVKDALVFEVLAWTPGTNGPVRAKAVNIQVPDRPTAEELSAFFASTRELVKGAIVLVGRPRLVPVNITPPAKRRADAELEAQYDPNRAGVARSGGRPGAPLAPPRPGALATSEASARVSQFLVDSGALVRVNDAARELGQITAFHNATYDLTKTVPTVVMRNEDYGRIARILGDGASVELEFNIVNRTFVEGRTAYNTIAEIPGSDRKEEVVMIGAHLDSWHSATGATDNAVGCAVMMEAARILNAIGAHPRRTIRVALWSGEEEGLLGSRAYVKEHFGSFEDRKPEFEKLVAYMNLDGGTGQLRGASVFGPASAAATLRGILAPFRDFGVWGTTATSSRALGGTDSTSFNQAGLPGINFQQDPIEYNTHTHHTNLDTYERVIEEDVKKAAVIVASAAYHLAMRDEMLTRFAPADMPPSPASRTSSSGKPD
ncbi:MAG TPA: M20/M25/M40 family metallo-hydrolase, partial [Thermoanaerobaculia bacterium]|nr:M20/M25/M40 family metallo-hydrolase [Thermoanaerobaculia bacterium]